ncbi:hypothetical protein JYG23_12425 [Sedimentibacter sp. zth1]|uniref:hypothetical protein n=1 Tax=Sedimentibacter sp. zth1 TaxID=2816908 RepID=UPI001A92C22F|nr:hypothetical protein [Sedimentibacter sp. zth1]QSX05474.1 hypothetical protein JYG23_12425 [Sedimentibacter sp. zth1]
MKQFIVLCAVFILLSAMFLQIPLQMMNYERKHAIMFYVNNAKEMAKQEGYYTDKILEELKENILTKMNIDKNQIIISESTTRQPKYRQSKSLDGEQIYIKISVPFNKIIAAQSLFGITNKKRYYVIENMTTSERLATQ